MVSFAKLTEPQLTVLPVSVSYNSPPKRLHCISLYTCPSTEVAKALLLPADQVFLTHLQQSSFMRGVRHVQDREDAIRLKFPSEREWGCMSTFLDVIRKFPLLCSVDLNRRGAIASFDLLFENTLCTDEMSCLDLCNGHKIRIYDLPNDEIPGIQSAAAQHWRVERASQKYGVDVLKFEGSPWNCLETSNDASIRSRRLLMGILKYMYTNGWTRVVSTNNSFSRCDADSIVFYRSQKVQHALPDVCCIMLEKKHKMRLVGEGALDQGTIDAFTFAANNHYRIKEQNDVLGTQQLKFEGRPWMVQSNEDKLRTARMVCGVLEAMFKVGWEWHCAICLYLKPSEKSSFFLRRGDSFRHAKVGCIQLKGHHKIHLVGFPSQVRSRVERALQSSEWTIPEIDVQADDEDLILDFLDQGMFQAFRTDHKIRTISFVRRLLEEVLHDRDASFLGTADMSSNTFKYDSDTPLRPQDTDVFFFAFGHDKGSS